MALNFLLKRSGTASKRPVAASMALGEVDINYNASTGGLFYKDSAGGVVKVGPAEVGSSAPNSAPVGSAGNSVGEFWYDTGNSVLKIWNGTSWVETVSTSGFLSTSGGSMTGNLYISNCELQVESTSTFVSSGTATFTGTTDLNGSTSFFFTPTWLENIGPASQVTYDNTTSGLVATDVQAAVDELASGSWLPAATTTTPGIVQLNDTTSSTSTTEALTANQGKELQDQINALSIASNITLAGTIDAATGNLATITAEGTTAGFTIGDPLPAAASGNDNYFVIVTTPGTMTPPGGSAQECHQGDWWLSDGTAWVFLDVGFNATAATTTTPGVVQLATDIEVQDGLNTDHSVTPSGLQSKLSDSTSTTSSTTIASSTAVKAAYDHASLAITDAATAQGTADFAQADATQALADAAAAQATADAAVPNASYTALGDVLGGTGAGTYSALTLGIDGDVLTADSTCATGLKWAPAGGSVAEATPTVPGTVYGFVSAGGKSSGNASVGAGSLSLADGNPVLANSALGNNSLMSLSDGANNTAVGVAALANGATLTDNVAIGSNALPSLVSAIYNTAVGTGVAFDLASGNCNVFLGWGAASGQTEGDCNVAIGTAVALPNPTGSCQLAIGLDVFFGNWITGDSTKAIKPGAGIIDCAGSCGTAGQVLMSNGANAICWGTAGGGGGSGTVTSITAGTGLTGGTITTTGTIALDLACVIAPSALTAKGSLISASDASTPSTLTVGTDGQILYACSTAVSGLCWAAAPVVPSAATPLVLGTVFACTPNNNDSLRLGFCAGPSVTGTFNTYLGTNSGRLAVAATNNVGVGRNSLCGNAGSNSNVAIGTDSIMNINAGNCNVAVGRSAIANGTGSNNVAIGFAAGQGGCLTTGSNNVLIGNCAQPASPTGSCQLAIGWDLNQYWLTGTSTKAIKPGAGIIDCANSCGTVGQYLWTTGANAIVWSSSSPSDVRDKEVVGPVPTALPIIQQIEPITYRWKERESNVVQEEVIYGFSAQQLQRVDPILVDSSDLDHLRIHDRKLIPLLVNAIKELSVKNDALEARIQALENN